RRNPSVVAARTRGEIVVAGRVTVARTRGLTLAQGEARVARRGLETRRRFPPRRPAPHAGGPGREEGEADRHQDQPDDRPRAAAKLHRLVVGQWLVVGQRLVVVSHRRLHMPRMMPTASVMPMARQGLSRTYWSVISAARLPRTSA